MLHLFTGFSYDRHPHILDEASVSLAHFTLTLGGTESSTPPRTGCAWDGNCPACADPRAAGRWIVRDPAGLGLETSCIVTPSMRTKDGNPMCGDKKLHALATTWQSAQGLAYQPYNCRHAPVPCPINSYFTGQLGFKAVACCLNLLDTVEPARKSRAAIVWPCKCNWVTRHHGR